MGRREKRWPWWKRSALLDKLKRTNTMGTQAMNGLNQITEQPMLKDLVMPKAKRTMNRLSATQSFKLYDWLKNNAESLQKQSLNRTQIAGIATAALGFPVVNSMIVTAERAIEIRVTPETTSNPVNVMSLQRKIEELTKRIETLEQIVKEFV
jgi:hypothetical protein